MIRIEVATAADGVVVDGLVGRAYAMYVERMGKRPAPMDVDHGALAERGEVLVARLDGEVVGALVSRDGVDHWFVENVVVDPAAHGLGLGRRLLDEADRLAAATGHPELRLYTNEKMIENLSLYPHLGFVEVERAVSDGFRRVWFSRPVAPAT